MVQRMTIAATVQPTVSRPNKPDLRARIVAAAWEIAGTETAEGLTIRSIAARAGVSPALLYTYFDGKAALVRELQRLARPELDALLGLAMEDADTPPQALARVCLAYIDYARKHRWLCEGGDPELRGNASIVTETFVARVVALLEAQGADLEQAETSASRSMRSSAATGSPTRSATAPFPSASSRATCR
jgi:AcrR family transcriptional regulator